MISLIAPFALWGAALLSVPIILHLFKPRKVRRTPFSSLRWLHLTQQKLARRIRWHQVLLFLLRFAMIALLVLAAAKPIFNRAGAASTVTVDRFLVIDVSRSMGYHATGRPTRPIDQAKEAAARIVEQSLPGDRTTVLLTDTTTRSLGPLTRDPSIYLAALKTINAGAGDTDLGSALRVIRPMLARHEEADIQIDFVTDNQQGAWRNAEIGAFAKTLGRSVRVRVVDVGVADARNAWIAGARVVPAPAGGTRGATVRVQVACIGNANPPRTVRLTGVKGMPDATRPITPTAGALARLEFELPAGLPFAGQIARVTLEPADALPDDDTFFLNLDPPDTQRVLIVEPDTTRIESMRPGFYLRSALLALSQTDGREISVTTKPPERVAASDVESADVVILADVPRLPDETLAALERYVKELGGGVAIFLGPSADLSFYNAKLGRALSPADGLFSAPLGAAVDAPAGRLDRLADVSTSHPLLSTLQDAVLGDLAQVTCRRYYPFDAQSIASIAGRAPAIVDRAVGTGRVVVLNATPNDAWTDLPRRKSFVPLIDRLIGHLAGGAGLTGGGLHVGDSVTLRLPPDVTPAPHDVTVIAPDGSKLTPVVEERRGRTVIRLDSVAAPGVYRVEPAGASVTQSFVVQSGRGDSVVTPADTASLRKWWSPAEVSFVAPDDLNTDHLGSATRSGAAAPRVPLWPWLAAAACAVFIAEMFLVHWLCPRMNPNVASPGQTIVRRAA
jgi:hypothetical protein